MKRSVKPQGEMERIIRGYGGDEYDVERLHFLRPPSSLVPNQPVFYMSISLNKQFGTLVQKINRGEGYHTAPPGRYACFLAWDWKQPLLPAEEPKVNVPRKLIEEVLEAFRSGIIPEGTETSLRIALQNP
jgi:hypothetical protein